MVNKNTIINIKKLAFDKKFLSTLWRIKPNLPLFDKKVLELKNIAKEKLTPRAFTAVCSATYDGKKVMISKDNNFCFNLNFSTVGKFSIKNYFSTTPKNIHFQLVTLGKQAIDILNKFLKDDNFSDYFFWHGFCAMLTESCADYTQENILKIGLEHKRYSFGYPSCGELFEQKKIVKMFNTNDVVSNDLGELEPIYSTCGVVIC